MRLTNALAFFITTIFIISCNNESDKPLAGKKTVVDSLQELVDDAHIAGMAKMGQLTRLQQQTAHLLDSINKLPAKAQKNVSAYKTKLDSLLKDLNYAEFAMDKWMTDFYSKDTLIKETKERLQFLEIENEKVTKVREAILSGIKRADTILLK